MARLRTLLAALLLGVSPLAPAAAAEPATIPDVGVLPGEFDSLGAAVQALRLPDGRTVHYVDTGERGWRPVLFIPGTGTSARSLELTEFLRTLRQRLKLRLISVERNGFGDTAFRPDWTYADYAAEVRAVLDHLGVDRFAIVAISGGGPYLARVAADRPERVISLHLLAALSQRPAGDPLCAAPAGVLADRVAPMVRDPRVWWGFPADSPTHRIPGFADRAREEGARAFFGRGQMGDPAPEIAEMQRYCEPLPSLAAVRAPAFIYQGDADLLVTPDHAETWRAALPKVARLRLYPGEGHDVQYRHWDQVLVDVAGHPDRLVVCRDGRTLAAPEHEAARLLAGGASLGVCAWRR